MRQFQIGLALAVALALSLSLSADVRPKGSVTPVEVDENGLLIVKVRLASKKPSVPDRDFRFILDTGATLNVLDASVSPDFFWEEPEKPKGASSTVGDATGQRVATRIINLKRMELAGMVREDLMAYRMDLRGTMLGRLQDEPVDGILGMNFLRGTRFVLDPIAREIRWWQDVPGYRIPIAYGENDLPILFVKVAGTDVPCTLDTGDNGGIQMNGDADETDHPEPFFTSGASGVVVQGKTVKVDRLDAGGKAWRKVSLDLVKEGKGGASLGRVVLWAAPLGLDFIDQWATFTLDSQGDLPYRKPLARAPLAWERRANGQRLLAERISPASRWAKAGLKEGDEVLAVGALDGKALTIRAAKALIDRGQALTWRVLRAEQEVLLTVPPSE